MAQQSIEFREKYGQYPLWTNSIFGGMPAFQVAIGATANITLAWLHHVFILFLPSPAGLFFLACLGFYLLCISLGVRNWVAIMASLGYAFASYNAVIVAVGHTTKFASMGYAPAVLAGLVLLTQRRYLLGFVTTLIFTTQLFYQNHVQIVYYTLLIAVCLGIGYAVHALKRKEGGHLLKTAGLAVVAGLLGMLSYAVVLFPTYDYAKETMRGGRSELTTGQDASNKSKGGLNKDYAFAYSYGLTEVMTIIVPRLYGGSSSEMQPGSKTAGVFMEKTGMGEEQANQYAQGMPAYWGPQLGTSGAVYFGAVICILFIFGIFFYTGWHRNWILAATLLGILLAWGKSFPAFNYFLFDYLPFYNKFRAPSMALVIPQLTIPLLAALGLNQFLEKNVSTAEIRKKFRRAAIVAGVVAAALAVMYLMLDYRGENDGMIRDQLSNSLLQGMSQGQQPAPEMVQQAQDFGRAVTNALKEDRRSLYGADLVRSLAFMALALALLYLFTRNKLAGKTLAIGLTLLVFVDLIGVDLRYLSAKNYVEKEEFEDAFTPTAADLEVMKDTSYYRVFNQSLGDPFQLSGATSRTSYLHNSVGGYHPAKLGLYDDLIKEQLIKGNRQVFNMLNTKYFIVANPTNGQPMVQQNLDALGPAWYVSAIRYVADANEEMRAMDNFHPADTAIIEEREQPKIAFEAQPDSSASVRLVENLNDRITYQSSAQQNGFVVFSEIYYPNGWKAFVDEKEVPIVRVNYVLRGLSIPAGEHQIEFRFEPASYIWGNRISIGVGIVSILILLYGLVVLIGNYRKTVQGNKS